MSERVNDLRIWAKWARVVAGADELAKDLDRAADTIAALEREAKPVKFRWEKLVPMSPWADLYCGRIRVGTLREPTQGGRWYVETLGGGWCDMYDTEAEARAALEAEVLKQLRGGE